MLAALWSVGPARADLSNLRTGGAYGYLNPYVSGEQGGVYQYTTGAITRYDANGTFSASSSLNAPLVTATVNVTAGHPYQSAGLESDASVHYEFAVWSPYDWTGGPVPIKITGFASVSADPNATAYGTAVIGRSSSTSTSYGQLATGYLSRSTNDFYCAGGLQQQQGHCGVTMFSVTENILPYSVYGDGEIGVIQLTAVAKIAGNTAVFSQASATVDPVITIDPGYLALHPGAEVRISPLVSNQAAMVPEPLSAALGLAGVAVVLVWRRPERLRPAG